MASYNHKEIEKKWQKKWEEEKVYSTNASGDKKKWYGLVEFPYPSGSGLHVGHVRSYTGMDIIARKRRAEGYEVLFPIGWDAFGLPAENYAIKTGIHPSIITEENIRNFRRQLKSCGFSFDWDREVHTADPQYYMWTQWIFSQMYTKGLAYKKEMPVNWCPKDKCVLANEEVIDGACERCGTLVEKKNKQQWMLAITKYAERLDKDLDETAYLEKIKIQQRNWIGMSEGSEIDFILKAGDTHLPFTIFTTRADTLFGCTYCVLAPEHAIVEKLLEGTVLGNKEEVIFYKDAARLKLDIDRSAEGKVKTGVRLEGVVAINPANNEEVPVFIADYVLPHYGTGAIMAVPAHDERDYQFAKQYNLPIRDVVGKHFDLTGNHKEKEGVETLIRRTVDPILVDKEGNVFCVKEPNGDIHFAGGGVDEGETDAEALAREIKEETGFTDFVITKPVVPYMSVFGFRHTKQKNQRTSGPAYEVLLQSNNRIHSEVEDGDHELVVLKKEEVLGALSWEHHRFIFEQYLKKDHLFTGEGILTNSGQFSGLKSLEARKKITDFVHGRIVKKSKLRDWVFARQRYWGEPIPLVYDKDGALHPVHVSNLPVTLPQVDKYEPTENGESPLYQVPEWVYVKGYLDDDGYFHQDETKEEIFRRETDTMPQWAGSSWYFMRYVDPHNKVALGSDALLAKWLPVDWYNGGMEHTTLHLLYSRFWYKFLFDIGIVPTSEPYYRRTSQGMILGEGGVKMSKSLGNVVNPDEIIEEYGADTLRLYEMFIGPFDQAIAWNAQAVSGVKRFLDKVYGFKSKIKDQESTLPETHKLIKKVTEDIETMSFNTSVSQMMIWANFFEKEEFISSSDFKLFLQVLSLFAPHLGEELWEEVVKEGSVHAQVWPRYDPSMLITSEVTIALQISGKLRGTLQVPHNTEDVDLITMVKNHEMYQKYTGNIEPKKIIIIKNKVVNIVI
jgi:leucyl-tRNA synthetase